MMRGLRLWLWEAWRDQTWARVPRLAWLCKMQGYHDSGGHLRAMAESRVRTLVCGGCWDWDDNVPERWARTLARRWRLL